MVKRPYGDVSSGARSLNFGLSLHAYQNLLYVGSEGSGVSAHLGSPEHMLLDNTRPLFHDALYLHVSHVR